MIDGAIGNALDFLPSPNLLANLLQPLAHNRMAGCFEVLQFLLGGLV